MWGRSFTKFLNYLRYLMFHVNCGKSAGNSPPAPVYWGVNRVGLYLETGRKRRIPGMPPIPARMGGFQITWL